MSMFGGPGVIGGIHSEVLKATPTDLAGKVSLIAEIKTRGRNAFASGNYPEAEMLYAKGIEVSDDDALKGRELSILHANRALARLNLGKVDEALNDGIQSTEEDATYVKGWWRKAQALVALNRHKEAKTAFLEAQKIEPKNSQLKKELAKVESKIEQQALLADSDDAPPAITEPVMTTTKSYSGSKTTTKTTSTTTKGTTARASKPVDEKVVDGDAGDDDDGEKIRGYKLNKDGKKTSFFNKDLSEEDKKLIGDITPKAIAKAEDAATPAALKKEKGVSAWNTAGTWEEKNLDNWGNDGMKKLLRESSFTIPPQIAPDAVIKVDKVKDFDGSVSVVKVRGKTRCNYEFSFTLEWSVTLPSGPCKGTLQFPDVAPDCDGEFETQFIVDKTTPPDAKGVLNTFVKSDSEGLKREIVNNINKWVKDYRAEYLS